MRKETPEKSRPLRTGFTTGACATAASVAAARLLFGDTAPRRIEITLPGGRCITFKPDSCIAAAQGAEASIIKDAGDDPDVTHGARIIVQLVLTATPGVEFVAGRGVGTVTRPGLTLAVGEPAINPVPRQMICGHLLDLARENNYKGGFEVKIGVENGEQLAKNTMNSRIGIVGGLSILGTTGIVRPFSCSAYIASIHQSIDVARANDIHHLAACTGSASERFIHSRYALDPMAIIEMGDFVGAVLKHLKKFPVDQLTIAGGFGKMSKFAAGRLDLHSSKSTIDFHFLADIALNYGAQKKIASEIVKCNTSQQAAEIAAKHGIPLADHVCKLGCQFAQNILPESIDIEIWALDRGARPLGHSGCLT